MKLRAEGRTYSSETFNRKKRKAAGKADGQGRPKKKVKVKSSQRNKAPYNVSTQDSLHSSGWLSAANQAGFALPSLTVACSSCSTSTACATGLESQGCAAALAHLTQWPPAF